ncbi:uncharacterized protein ASCRUDRAFT_112467 [Ascoidea rubescens DSM 1968]|uniref:Uncharacterized protein n=1 Tax=Ascoidea rubescens DSM 1968 TaxID=1344418 RepID=A0A1D2VD48_9ASCO|nr:hypothetical protein ASCRUDRAFT_112467 [Ascoidea rubescens DSM 1968]ODV59423.1 hypothetical protein ASCRUDRAFT_112467 [Ascoidea rubescens DSM 1968]
MPRWCQLCGACVSQLRQGSQGVRRASTRVFESSMHLTRQTLPQRAGESAGQPVWSSALSAHRQRNEI